MNLYVKHIFNYFLLNWFEVKDNSEMVYSSGIFYWLIMISNCFILMCVFMPGTRSFFVREFFVKRIGSLVNRAQIHDVMLSHVRASSRRPESSTQTRVVARAPFDVTEQ